MQKRDLYYDRIPTKLLREDIRHLGNILGKMAIHMMDIGKKVSPMELANIVGRKNQLLTKECLKMVNWKVSRLKHLLKAQKKILNNFTTS